MQLVRFITSAFLMHSCNVKPDLPWVVSWSWTHKPLIISTMQQCYVPYICLWICKNLFQTTQYSHLFHQNRYRLHLVRVVVYSGLRWIHKNYLSNCEYNYVWYVRNVDNCSDVCILVDKLSDSSNNFFNQA